jgi:2'-5' RNA ligase
MRCFVALELPAEVRAAAGKTMSELKRVGVDVKWMRPENLHGTLTFLGVVVEDTRALEVGRAVEDACVSCPLLELALAGAFTDPHRLQVVWPARLAELSSTWSSA